MASFASKIDFSQSNPPKPANQGGMAGVHVQAPKESDAPATGFIEPEDNSADAEDINLRGYKTEGIGGSASPGTPNALGMESRSQMS